MRRPAAPEASAVHEHEWHLDYVDFEDHGAVTAYTCASCSALRFE
jgi:hypothetical protein